MAPPEAPAGAPLVPLGVVELMPPVVEEPAAPVPPAAAPEAGAAAASGVVLAVEDDGAADDDASAAPASAVFLAQAPRVRKLAPARARAVFDRWVMMNSLRSKWATAKFLDAARVPDRAPRPACPRAAEAEKSPRGGVAHPLVLRKNRTRTSDSQSVEPPD